METYLTKRGEVELRPWQAEALPIVVAALRKHGAAIDASSLGVGKTFVAAFAAMEVCPPDKRIVVIAPKAVLPSWRRSFEAMQVDPARYFVVNYERLRMGVPGIGGWTMDKKRFIYDASVGFVAADEAHRLRSYELNLSCRMLIGAKLQDLPRLFMSATLAESPCHLRTIGHGLGLHNGRNFVRWATDRGAAFDNFGKLYLKPGQAKRVNTELNKLLFPAYGVRIRSEEIPGYPETDIVAEALDFGTTAEIRAVYAEMEDELAELMEKVTADKNRVKEQAAMMVAQLRARQRVELLKVPLVASMVEESVEQGRWVAVFLNFRASLEALKERLAKHRPAEILGGQSEKARELEIDRFQVYTGGTPVILIQIQSGGAGISLPDTFGDRPRETIIFPPYSASDLRQATGRVHRATSKSRSSQRIIFAAGTCEEAVMKKVQVKLTNLDTLQDADVHDKHTLNSPEVVMPTDSSQEPTDYVGV